ncbi:MAG: hypothetical protein V2A53_01630 [bacterium]
MLQFYAEIFVKCKEKTKEHSLELCDLSELTAIDEKIKQNVVVIFEQRLSL